MFIICGSYSYREMFLKENFLSVRKFRMLSYGCDNDSRFLFAGFRKNDFFHYFTVFIIQMAGWLIQKDKIERLAERADESDPLLLSERELAGLYMYLIPYA